MRHQVRSRGSILFILPAQPWKHPAPTRASLPYSPPLSLFGNPDSIVTLPPHLALEQS
ncbi:hypothetical protein CSOJ01_01911 [Colletotrichum sojae]|uniref:Uncharacterized protein n=1 Tax=Colletotrichum sojae TaxID=2175907 RepID=A0A8H6N3N7_9PEZI|nr:hypothetical protein CSOJ01_01911 [Colletotrichum sojae]